jgi:hypothetical protein
MSVPPDDIVTNFDEPVSDAMVDALFTTVAAEEPKKPAVKPAIVPQEEKTNESKEIEAPAGDDDASTSATDELTDDDLANLETKSEDEDAEAPVLDENQEIEVKVDGQNQKVTLKQLRENYSGEKFIEKRIQQATEAKNAAEQQANGLFEASKVTVQKLTALDNILNGFTQPNVDWADLKARDPLAYALKREEVRDMQDRQNQVRQEIERENARQAELTAQATQNYLSTQAEALIQKLPVMGDPNKGAALMGRLKKAASSHYGYTDSEVDSVMDHRAIMVLHDATLYREAIAKRGTKSAPITEVQLQNKEQPKTLKTVASKPAVVASKQREQAIVNKARQTGNPDDVAMTLLVPQRRKG